MPISHVTRTIHQLDSHAPPLEVATDRQGAPRGGRARRWSSLPWRGSLRARLIAIVIALDVFAAILTGTVIVVTARSATKVEIDASMRLADVLVSDTIRLMQDLPPSLILATLDLHFQNIRHVRIAVTDEDGTIVRAQSSLASDQTGRETSAPTWFARLVAPPADVKVFPLLVRNRRVGAVTITAEPADEIAEAWQYTDAVFVTGLCLNLVVFAMLFVLFGRALRPLTALARGLENLQGQNYRVRLARPSLPELATIADHFNLAAGALASADDANRALNRKLVTAQDDERRRTALELHDEVGPFLFALDVNTASMMTISGRLDDGAEIGDLASETAGLVKQVQGINRRLLDRLRPMSLGRIPLEECLLNLLVDLSRDDRPVVHHEIGPLEPTYGPLVDLTIYRCLQEGLFNAIRHAQARRIDVTIKPRGGSEGRLLSLMIRDDGRGLAPRAKPGVGLSGMHERTEALGGHFDLVNTDTGTVLTISVPIVIDEAGPAARTIACGDSP